MDNNKVIAWIFDKGLGIAVLVAASWLLLEDRKKLNEENRLCNQRLIEIYQEQNIQLVEALGRIEQKLTPTHGKEKR